MSRVPTLMQAWLSSRMLTGALLPMPISDSICSRYAASCVAAPRATYSASAVDRDWLFYIKLLKIMAPLFNKKE